MPEAPAGHGEQGALIHLAVGPGAHHATWLNVFYDLNFPGLGHPLLRTAGGQELVSPFVPNMLLVAVALSVLAIVSGRAIKGLPQSRFQAALTMAWQYFRNFSIQIIGEQGPRHAPLLGSLFIFILAMNLLGLIPGFLSPTSNLSITAALALFVFVAVQWYGVREQGAWGYAKHFIGEPWWLFWLNIPIHIIGELARPLSLAVRLRGNIFGEDTAIVIFIAFGAALFRALPIPIPLQLPMLAFGVFGSVIQALVFTVLSAVYIAGAVEHAEEH